MDEFLNKQVEILSFLWRFLELTIAAVCGEGSGEREKWCVDKTVWALCLC